MQKDAKVSFSSLKVDGGASNNNLLMQLQADVLKKTVIRPKTTETTALGAAFFAGLAVGLWTNIDALKSIWIKDQSFTPGNSEQTDSIVKQWENQIQKVVKK